MRFRKKVEKTVTNVVEKEVTVDSTNNESATKNETVSGNTETVNSQNKINADAIIEVAADNGQVMIRNNGEIITRLNRRQKFHQKIICQQ